MDQLSFASIHPSMYDFIGKDIPYDRKSNIPTIDKIYFYPFKKQRTIFNSNHHAYNARVTVFSTTREQDNG